MRKYATTLVLLLLPTVALAQGEGRPGRREHAGKRGNVIQMMIEHKADLALTAEQIAKLEPIGKKLEEQNKPVVEEMQKIRGTTNVRELSQEQREQMRAQMGKLREHRKAAMTEANTILTQEQQTKLRDMMQKMAPGRRGAERRSGQA
jgi:hypothetical protein